MTIQLLTIVLTVKYRMIKVLVERQAVYYLRSHFLQNLELAFQFVFQLLEKRRLLQLHFHFLLQNSYFLLDLFDLVGAGRLLLNFKRFWVIFEGVC